jgi:hypothetical protein
MVFEPLRCHRFSFRCDMRRREFITLLGGAAVSWPLVLRAQQVSKVYRIGILETIAAAQNAASLDAAEATAGPRLCRLSHGRPPKRRERGNRLFCDDSAEATGLIQRRNDHNRIFLMSPVGAPTPLDTEETSGIRWATFDEAAKLIRLTKNKIGQARDLSVLEAARGTFARKKAPSAKSRFCRCRSALPPRMAFVGVGQSFRRNSRCRSRTVGDASAAE